jgi:hypothetical protein
MAEITVPKGVNFTSSYVPETKELSPMEQKSLEEKIKGMSREEKVFMLKCIEDEKLLFEELDRRMAEYKSKVLGIKEYADSLFR